LWNKKPPSRGDRDPATGYAGQTNDKKNPWGNRRWGGQATVGGGGGGATPEEVGGENSKKQT